MKSLIVLGGLNDSLQVFGAFGPSEGITGVVVAGEEAVEQIASDLELPPVTVAVSASLLRPMDVKTMLAPQDRGRQPRCPVE